MTTTLELFKWTAPATKKVRTLDDSRVYDALADEIYKALDHDASDEENTSYITVKIDQYTAEISIRFEAEWHRESEWYQDGNWVTTRLTDITPIDIYKTYEVDDDEYYINLDLDINRLWKMIKY